MNILIIFMLLESVFQKSVWVKPGIDKKCRNTEIKTVSSFLTQANPALNN